MLSRADGRSSGVFLALVFIQLSDRAHAQRAPVVAAASD